MRRSLKIVWVSDFHTGMVSDFPNFRAPLKIIPPFLMSETFDSWDSLKGVNNLRIIPSQGQLGPKIST